MNQHQFFFGIYRLFIDDTSTIQQVSSLFTLVNQPTSLLTTHILHFVVTWQSSRSQHISIYYILPALISSTPALTTFLRWLCFSQVKFLQIYQGSPIQEADIVGYQASLGLPWFVELKMSQKGTLSLYTCKVECLKFKGSLLTIHV